MNETVYWNGTGNDTADTTFGGYIATAPNNEPVLWNTLTISGSGEPERDKNMRRLYRITVVNPKTEEITGPFLVVAKGESGALLKANFSQEVRTNSDKYDICVEIVGDVRAKKETQKVKVIEGDEE